MFKTFPDFSSISLEDKEEYDALVRDFPPISDLSFATLMIWWNFEDNLKVSTLNGNLVVSYVLPGDEQNSGLALVGTRRVDESVRAIFAELKAQGMPERLVHVPEFVVDSIKDPSQFAISEERDYDEYIIPIDRLYPMQNLTSLKRWKIKKFLEAVGDRSLETKTLDLNSESSQSLLIRAMDRWQEGGAANDPERIEREAVGRCLRYGKELGVQNVCMYVDGRLVGFALFQVTHDREYIIANHICTSRRFPRSFDYMTYLCAEWASERGIPYLNMEMDLGIQGLRSHKMELKPETFFRKYELRPLS